MADFDGVVFEDKALFQFATFTKSAWFSSAEFQKEAEFTRTTFREEAVFIGARFKEKTWFRNVTFQGYTLFTGAVFGEAFFTRTTFQGEAMFDGAVFQTTAKFVGAQFHKSAFFIEAIFESEADFSISVFYGGAFFIQCSFSGMANFAYTTFDNQAIFINLSNGFPGYLVFLSTAFKKPTISQIIGYPLSRVSFMTTDIEGILLVPAREEEEDILDEIILKKGGQKSADGPSEEDLITQLKYQLGPYITRETLQFEYKLIRKCLEVNRMFTEAADFFVREMRLARQRLPRRNFLEKIAHCLYDILSRYGESINRPILFALSVNLLTPILLLLLPPPNSFDIAISRLSEYTKYLEAVFAVFMQVRSFKDIEFMKNVPVIIEILIRIFAIIILGNLFVAVKRRLERR